LDKYGTINEGKAALLLNVEELQPTQQEIHNTATSDFCIDWRGSIMRLRRLEFAVIALTLAFLCFMGGYFTGRSQNTVNITPSVSHQNDAPRSAVAASPPATVIPDSSVPGEAAPPVGGGQASEPPPSSRDAEGRININLASKAELMDLPGIGSVLSERIVEYRRQNGSFSKIEDIRNVSGIGEKRFETIRDKITV